MGIARDAFRVMGALGFAIALATASRYIRSRARAEPGPMGQGTSRAADADAPLAAEDGDTRAPLIALPPGATVTLVLDPYLNDDFSLAPAAACVLAAAAHRFQLLVLAHAASDSDEEAVRTALAAAAPECVDNALFFEGDGAMHMVRQLGPALHIDADAERAAQLARFIPRVDQRPLAAVARDALGIPEE
eukprot:gnl/Chilomastix_cuspidata/4850.p2 GENE.gnl/Chilomastix_cuspidata/4850~~gnl/Chilomastix_cuspidata/4850.p2  ORF type:complete len:190 (-),score=89.53 gnl/Chilomastix_cuspidata/4850:146-715(-)